MPSLLADLRNPSSDIPEVKYILQPSLTQAKEFQASSHSTLELKSRTTDENHAGSAWKLKAFHNSKPVSPSVHKLVQLQPDQGLQAFVLLLLYRNSFPMFEDSSGQASNYLRRDKCQASERWLVVARTWYYAGMTPGKSKVQQHSVLLYGSSCKIPK